MTVVRFEPCGCVWDATRTAASRDGAPAIRVEYTGGVPTGE